MTGALFSYQEQPAGTWTSCLVLEHGVEDYLFFLKARGEDQTSLFEGCGELHPFFLRVCSLPFFEQVEEIVRISFPYLERKEVSSSRLRGRRSSLSFS